MANKPITMSKLRKVLQLYLNGKSKKFISNYLNLSRNTVKKYLIELNALNLSIEDIKKLSDLDLEKLFIEKPPVVQSTREAALYKFFPYMEKELKKTGVTRMIIWQEYLAKHPDGFRRTQFNKRYNKWSKKVNGPSKFSSAKIFRSYDLTSIVFCQCIISIIFRNAFFPINALEY